uniref:Protein kinase domain-containing protein n=1 Tax=viral metagenome TaxID=1070528 RepID=A0A6C0ATN7_9ZZZZ
MKTINSSRKRKGGGKKGKDKKSMESKEKAMNYASRKASKSKTPSIFRIDEDEDEDEIQSPRKMISRIRDSKARRIQKFMRKTQRRRKELFLKAVCSDSGECISLGREIDKIKEFFNGFTKFQYVLPPIVRKGAVSENGFINQIVYKKDNYISHAILKSAKRPDSDNLMYEYLVGQYINKQCKRFPCFVETYGLYKYKNEASWEQLKAESVNRNVLSSNLELLTKPDLAIGCKDSQYIAILIEDIPKPITLREAIQKNVHDPDEYNFFEDMFLPILFQIYTPLAILKDEFTHYDLHMYNVLLYEAKNDGYFECHYELPPEDEDEDDEPRIVSFKTKYIPKIIDYGRSYFKKSEMNNSSRIYDKLCETSECEPDCGNEMGFTWLKTEELPVYSNYIDSKEANNTHDLRLLKHFLDTFDDYFEDGDPELYAAISSINYKMKYGSPSVNTSGLPSKINNVEDAYVKFSQMMINSADRRIHNQRIYYGKPKVGDIYVYCNSNKNMVFVPSSV